MEKIVIPRFWDSPPSMNHSPLGHPRAMAITSTSLYFIFPFREPSILQPPPPPPISHLPSSNFGNEFEKGIQDRSVTGFNYIFVFFEKKHFV